MEGYEPYVTDPEDIKSQTVKGRVKNRSSRTNKNTVKHNYILLQNNVLFTEAYMFRPKRSIIRPYIKSTKKKVSRFYIMFIHQQM